MLTLEQANIITSAALSEARKLNLKPISVVVLDNRAATVSIQSEDGVSIMRSDIAKAKANGAAGPRLERQLFYAHLYLGLWYEAKKELKLRDKYIGLAATVADQHGYMGDVARVHAVLNKIKVPKPAAEK